jgi:hypothetical protein
MANLSNINNKFLFTDGDFLKIGNSAPINNVSSTESGISITNPNVASIALDSDDGGKLNFFDVDANSVRLQIEASGDSIFVGNVGVGVSTINNPFSAQAALQVGDTSTTTNNGLITIGSGTAGSGDIYFADGISGGSAYRGFVSYKHNGDYLAFGTAETTRMIIDSSGNLLIGAGLGNPYLALISAGGNGGNERARMFGYADGGTYGGGLKLQTRDNSNIFNDALIIDRSGNAVIKGKIESVKELVNINSANGIRSAGLESDSTGNIWLGTGTTAATINFVTGNSTNSNPSVNGVKRLTTNREGTDVYASYAGSTFPFRVGQLIFLL